jgi:hypothetical protein
LADLPQPPDIKQVHPSRRSSRCWLAELVDATVEIQPLTVDRLASGWPAGWPGRDAIRGL